MQCIPMHNAASPPPLRAAAAATDTRHGCGPLGLPVCSRKRAVQQQQQQQRAPRQEAAPRNTRNTERGAAASRACACMCVYEYVCACMCASVRVTAIRPCQEVHILVKEAPQGTRRARDVFWATFKRRQPRHPNLTR
ncbi:hypothetical protein PLESTB_000119700 [Pleodorina starrii]|uniref:Uncharacterized protein n=1 Tax=Pleodorina starrii TaxID=330485 RepID=A0A9W6BAP3_9CHLO|nr:hypothetical protein PLESTB_000119700 [Pleodorina starrii]GLC76361.1 hypothetical protein PLESTF_001771200 [Pleodorina starrii]